MAATVVRTLTVRSREEGAPQVARALHNVADAYKTVVRTTQEGARVIDMTASKLASTERGWDRLTGRIEGNAAAYKTFVRESTLAKQALDAGLTTFERYGEVVGHLRQELQAAGSTKFGLSIDQSSLNAILGVNAAISKSAREAAAVFEEEARAAESAAAEAARHAAKLDDLRASFDPVHDAARKMAGEVERLAELERAGIPIMGGYEAALDRIVQKYDENAQAATRAAAARSKLIEQARADQSATNSAIDGQSMWNSYANVRTMSSGSARESASVFEEDARAMEAMQARATRLRAELNPLGAAYDQLNVRLADFREMADRHVISQDELAEASARARESFDRTAAALVPVNDNVKLSQHQLTGFSYQLNDVATMALSGADAFQIAATQAGQFYQVAQDHPNGIKGTLEATKNSAIDLAKSIGPIGVGLIAAGTAAVGLWMIFHERIAPMDEVLKRQAENIRALRDAYGLAAEGADNYGKRSKEALEADAAAGQRKTIERQMADAERVQETLAPFAVPSGDPRKQVFSELKSASDAFNASVRARNPDYATLEQSLGRIAKTTPYEPLRKVADDLRDSIRSNVEAQGGFKETARVMDEVAKRAERMGASFQTAMDALTLFAGDSRTEAQKIEDAFQSASDAAQSIGDAMRAKQVRDKAMTELSRGAVDQAKAAQDALSNLSLSPNARGQAETRQRYDAEIAELQRVNGAEEAIAAKRRERDAALQAGQIEIQRAEDARRAGYKLDLEAVTAHTAAAKASVAGERVRIDALAQGYSEAEAASRAEEQRSLSLAQAKEQLAESARRQSEAAQDQVSQIQMEIDLVGKSAGETARLRAEFDMLAQAKQAARDAGFDESTASLTEDMKKQAAAIGEATAQLEKLNFQRDLVFRLQQSGRSDQDQRIADQLRSTGIEFDSSEGRARAQQLRYVESVEKTSQALRDMREAGKDAFGSLIEAIGQGDNAMDAFISSFSRFGGQLSSAGFDKLFGGVFGTANPTGNGAGIGASVQSAGSAVSTASSDIVSRPLAALNDNLQKSSTSALAVAKQFDGLNARADSKVLDGFLQASGNWKGLSASDTAWCASFANASIIKAGGQGTGSNMASSFLNWGSATSTPKVGDIVVLRPQAAGTSGHVGFVAGFGDGKVQVFGGNQSGGANTKNFGLNQVAGYRTGDGLGIGDMTKAVADGTINAQKQIASGAVPGIQPSAGAQAAMSAGWDGFTGVDQGMSKLGTGMQTLGAGLGIFAQGAQSQSPIMGAIGGALGGFSAGAALGAGLGPVGAVLGGIVGGIGGLFGKSKAKKAKKKAEREQAQSAWDSNLEQFMALEDEVTRMPRGTLSKKLDSVRASLEQFDKIADKTGRSADGRRVGALQDQLQTYEAFLKDNFTRDLPQIIGDLGRGQGIETGFTKARDAVMQQADSYRSLAGDIKTAYAVPLEQRDKILASYAAAKKSASEITQRIEDYTTDSRGNVYRNSKTVVTQKDNPAALAAAIAERDEDLAAFDAKYGDALARMNRDLAAAREAAITGLLRIVSGDIPEQTDIQKAIEEARGAASGLRTALVDLGMSAEDTAVAIDKALAQRMTKLGTEFSQGLLDDINETNGKGYLAGFRDLIKARDKNLSDAASLPNVDTSLVFDWFKSQAQSIVDGAELTGDAFADLIKAFPELSGVVKEFAQEVTNTAAEIAQRLQGFYDRFTAATTDTSNLSGAMVMFNRRAAQERQAEAAAGGQGLVALDAALAAEKAQTIKGLLVSAYEDERQSIEDLADSLETFRDQVRDTRKSLRLDDNLSVLGQRDQAFEAQKEFREILAKANAGDKDAQAKLASAGQTYLEEFRAYFKSSVDYYNAFEEVQSALANTEELANSQLDNAKKQLETIKAQLDALNSIKDTVEILAGAYAAAQKEAAKAGDKAGLGGGSTGGVLPVGTNSSVSPQSVRYLANNADVAAAIANGDTFGLKPGFAPEVYAAAHYGLYGQAEGRGWATGGYTGPGGVNDVAGDVHRGEVVWSQSDIARHGGVGIVESMRLSRPNLPSFDRMTMARPAPPSNDNSLRLDKVESLLRTLIATTGQHLDRIAVATESTGRSSEEQASVSRRTASRGKR